jgi:hypothetical protein
MCENHHAERVLVASDRPLVARLYEFIAIIESDYLDAEIGGYTLIYPRHGHGRMSASDLNYTPFPRLVARGRDATTVLLGQ